MKRNSGRIGVKSTVSKTSANGLFDTFDNYNFRRGDAWPQPLSYNSLSPNSGISTENTSYTYTLSTSGLPTNTTLYFSVLLGTAVASDFSAGVTTGSFTQSSSTNTGSFTLGNTFVGNINNVARTFQIQIRTGGTAGPVVYTSGTFTIPQLTINTYTWNPASINEGSSSNLFLSFNNCGGAFTYTYNIAYSGTASSSSDFTTTLPTTKTFANPLEITSVINPTALTDITTEGTETLTAQVSYNGFSFGTRDLVIGDTSTTATGTITPSTTSVTEGTSVTFNCTISGSFTGTAFYSINNVTGTMSGSDFGDGLLTGSFTVTSGSGSFAKTLIADGSAENEQFTASLRTGSVTGPILGTTATITVVDAAAPSAVWSPYIQTTSSSNAATSPGLINNNYRRYILAWSYSSNEMQAALSGRTTASITGLRFAVTQQPTYQPYPNYAIGFKAGNFGGITVNPGSSGYTIVKAASSESFTTGLFKEFVLTPFTWTVGSDLAIAVAWGQSPTNFSSSGTSPRTSGNVWISRLDSAGTYVINTDAITTLSSGNRPAVQLFYS